MPPTLDYEPVARRDRGGRFWVAAGAMILAVLASGYAVYGAVDAARGYVGSFGGCATGRWEALFQLQVVSPIACSFAGVAWMVAKHVGAGVVLCRGATWVGVAGWLTACACAWVR